MLFNNDALNALCKQLIIKALFINPKTSNITKLKKTKINIFINKNKKMYVHIKRKKKKYTIIYKKYIQKRKEYTIKRNKNDVLK